jgi:hypothetical protein
LYEPKPVIKTFDVVFDTGYEKEAEYLVKRFEELLYTRDTLKPHLVAVLKGDGGISEEGKNQIRKGNPNAIVLGVKKPPKEGKTYSRGTLAEVKDMYSIDEYIRKIKRGGYEIVKFMGVDLLIEREVRGTAFNEVLAIRDTGFENKTIKFYAYVTNPNVSGPYKLFTSYFTDGLIVADGFVVGPPLGRGGYQRTCGVPQNAKGIGVGLLSPSIEKKDDIARIVEKRWGRELLTKGLVLPNDYTLGFKLKRGRGFVYVDHDRVADMSPEGLSKFEVKKSKQTVRFIKFEPFQPQV